jgi:hypothetical protein
MAGLVPHTGDSNKAREVIVLRGSTLFMGRIGSAKFQLPLDHFNFRVVISVKSVYQSKMVTLYLLSQ